MQKKEIETWFPAIEPSENPNGNYAHLKLAQAADDSWRAIRAQLIAFLEEAHRDARNYFNDDLQINLDSFGGDTVSAAYPSSLPEEALLGYFGEAFCGIICQALPMVGGRQWTVPVFLFRLHNAAFEHIHRLIYGEPIPTGIAGRTGTDFIALCLDSSRRVQAILAGEAKCHGTLNVTQAGTALEGLGKQSATPVSLGQLRRVLSDLPARMWRETVRSIEAILFTRAPVPRSDLFVYLFEDPGVVRYSTARLTEVLATTKHGCQRPLQVVEAHIPNLRALVADVYKALYSEGVTGGSS